jgi:putative addiction module CopG family antidote
MEVSLTPDQKAFIRHAIESGRLQHKEEAVREALSLWEERERKRAEFLASLDDAKTSTLASRTKIKLSQLQNQPVPTSTRSQ